MSAEMFQSHASKLMDASCVASFIENSGKMFLTRIKNKRVLCGRCLTSGIAAHTPWPLLTAVTCAFSLRAAVQSPSESSRSVVVPVSDPVTMSRPASCTRSECSASSQTCGEAKLPSLLQSVVHFHWFVFRASRCFMRTS